MNRTPEEVKALIARIREAEAEAVAKMVAQGFDMSKREVESAYFPESDTIIAFARPVLN